VFVNAPSKLPFGEPRAVFHSPATCKTACFFAQFAEAVVTAGLALQQAAIQHNTALVSSLETQSKFYEAGQPFHTAAN
jgi:hypothetical protein